MVAGRFSCGKCTEKFPTKAKLNEHTKSHKADSAKNGTGVEVLTIEDLANACIASTSGASQATQKETPPNKRSPRTTRVTKATPAAKSKPAAKSSAKTASKSTPAAKSTAKASTTSSKNATPAASTKKATSVVAKKSTPSKSKKTTRASSKMSKDISSSPVPQCSRCDKGFATERGLKKHMSVCKVMIIKRDPQEMEAEQNEDEQDVVKENGDSLRAQLRGKFTNRVRSLLKATSSRSSGSWLEGAEGSSAEESDKQGFQCDKCPAVFKLKSSVDRHKKVLHLEGHSHVCNICGARCADKGTLARHQYTHTGLKPFQCENCKRQFSRKYHLDRHLVETKCGGKDEAPTFPCMVCLKIFSRKSNLREHLKSHAGETNAKIYSCEFCQKEFHSCSLLQIHVRKHTGEKPFKCDHCEKMFPSMGAKKKHMRIHTGERPYECENCDAKFALKGTLNRHVRIHTGLKPHKCQFCGKMFIQSGGLKAHLFHHTGENGFQCGFCQKSFNRKARLQMHIKYIHEKTKPYDCDICVKSFVRKEDLNRHCALHSGVKPYVCPTCNKAFAIKPSLKLHLLTHTREEPKACHECGRAFIRQDCLLRHMRKRHRDMLEKIIQDAEKFRQRTVEKSPEKVLTEAQLAESIRELLSLLVDEPTLRGFGWPDKPVDQLLEAVIRRCGHTPVNPEDYTFMDRLRENSKLLFTVVIDDNAVRTLLNNQTVDEVILHVLRLAKA